MIEYMLESAMVLLLVFGGAAWFAVSRIRFGQEVVQASLYQSRRDSAVGRGRLLRRMGYCPSCHAIDDEECTYLQLGEVTPTGLGPYSVHLSRPEAL